MDLKELKELIELIAEKGFAEFELEREGLRLRISRFKEPPLLSAQPAKEAAVAVNYQGPPSATAAAPVATEPMDAPAPDSSLHIITSPIVGTFFRSPSPESDPFVRLGDRVEADTVVCIIEAMKLMNEIQAEVTGEVAKVFVENGQPVEYGQPLFGVKV